jgi:hypothetical protein
MLSEQVSEPLLRLHARAQIVAEGAVVTYYTKGAYHLGALERSMEELERAILDMRGALEAIRSREGDPLESPAWVPDVPIDDMPF